MMAKDVQNQQLADWLQLLGCPVELSPEDLQQLNNGRMRSVWRHLQAHVKPVSTVCTIKKNLLLAKLRTTNGVHHGNFKIETVQELVQLQKHSITQGEIDIVKGKVREVDEGLLSASNSLLTKVTEKECMMQNLDEFHKKTALLNLKLSCIQRDVDKLNEELVIAGLLKTSPATQMPYLDMKENKQLVAKFVQQFSTVEITEDTIAQMIVSTREFPPSLIFDEILSLSNNALKALSSSKIAVNSLLSNPNKLNDLSFSKHLTGLKITLFKNELEHHNCSRKVVACKAELDKDKAALCKVLEESVTSGNTQGLTLVELVDKIFENTLVVKRDEKLKELSDELQEVCSSDFNHEKWMVKGCKEKEDRLLTEVNKKLTDINSLIEQISTIQISSVKVGVLSRVRDLVSKYLNPQKNHQGEECPYQVLVSENLIGKEIEMFQKLPLVAMTRQWENSFETIPVTVREDILKAPERLNFLCQSESKNLIKNTVEKIFWLHANNHQSSD